MAQLHTAYIRFARGVTYAPSPHRADRRPAGWLRSCRFRSGMRVAATVFPCELPLRGNFPVPSFPCKRARGQARTPYSSIFQLSERCHNAAPPPLPAPGTGHDARCAGIRGTAQYSRHTHNTPTTIHTHARACPASRPPGETSLCLCVAVSVSLCQVYFKGAGVVGERESAYCRACLCGGV